MAHRPRALILHTVSDAPTIALSSHTTDEATRPREGDYLLLYPRWYRVDLEGVLQESATTRFPFQKVQTTAVMDWRLELETLLDLPLDQSLRVAQVFLTYVAFFDPERIVQHLRQGEATWFPPCAYVHLEPYLYHTDTKGRLQLLGAFSPYMTDDPDGCMARFWSLTGLPATTPILATPETLTP